MKIPFIDLKAQYAALKPEIDAAVQHVLDTQQYTLGEEVANFEKAFAEYCDAKYAVGVNSGTSALQLALLALGVGPEDEVVTVPHTFIATVEAISWTGAKPVFVDIDPVTYTMDPTLLEEAITPKTKAIIPVHLYGHPADMDPILEIAQKHGVKVLEDAAQAHGARYKGKRVGGLGDVASFSFYPGKNLGAYGEGGAVVTNDEKIAEHVKKLRNHGGIIRYTHEYIGMNARMEGIQGAVLNVKLPHLDQWNTQRREKAEAYEKALVELPLKRPQTTDWAEHVFHVYAVQSEDRDALIKHLNDNGIASNIYYPQGAHLLGIYKDLGYKAGDFPVTEEVTQKVLSLPLYPELSGEQHDYIINNLRTFSGAKI